MNKRWRQAGFVAAACLVLLSGCGPKDSPAPFGGGKAAGGPSEEALAGASPEVQSLYKSNCLSCHGNELEGRVGEKTNLQKVGERLTKDEIVKQIENGGRGMPGYSGKLKPEEIDSLATWLSEKK